MPTNVVLLERDRVAAHDFESAVIANLKDERQRIQQKTFTKWINSFLKKANLEINDIFTDLRDGRMLMKLLEIISGERLGRPNAGKLRVHRIENVNRCLTFLHTKVRLESIGAEDIVDGNERLILGLIWTIILRFQIQEIEVDVSEHDRQGGAKTSAKEALLLWCQRRLKNYPRVRVGDFTRSWRDGLAFCSLIHSANPDVLDPNSLDAHDHVANLKTAFMLAEREFGIPRLLDAEDVDVNSPDEKSIVTYVASYYHAFSRLSQGHKGAKRINNVIHRIWKLDTQQSDYDRLAKELVLWIQAKSEVLERRDLPNTVEELADRLKSLHAFRTQEKPPKCKTKVDLEAKYHAINSELSALRKPAFVPASGIRPTEIGQAWTQLEVEENALQQAIRAHMIRVQMLEAMAENFYKKLRLREGYINEMTSVLKKSAPQLGMDPAQVEAALRRHEAIRTDIHLRGDRVEALQDLCDRLCAEHYVHGDAIRTEMARLRERWSELQALADGHGDAIAALQHRRNLLVVGDALARISAEAKAASSSRKIASSTVLQQQIEKVHLLETELRLMGESLAALKERAEAACSASGLKAVGFHDDLLRLQHNHEVVSQVVADCKRKLEEAHLVERVEYDLEDIHLWIHEKIRLGGTNLDVLGRQVFEKEFRSWHAKYLSTKELAEGMTSSRAIGEKLASMEADWAHLRELADIRNNRQDVLRELTAIDAEVCELESWAQSLFSLLASGDHGRDVNTASAQLNRLSETDKLLSSLQSEVSTFVGANRSKPQNLLSQISTSGRPDELDGMVEETRQVAQVQALYPYQGSDIRIEKKEVMFLLARNNEEWWSVRKADGKVGFVPRLYVKEIDPLSVVVLKPTATAQQPVPIHLFELEPRMELLAEQCEELSVMASRREKLLHDHIALFRFEDACSWTIKWSEDQATIADKPRVPEMLRTTDKQADDLVKALPWEKERVERKRKAVRDALDGLLARVNTQEKDSARKELASELTDSATDTLAWIKDKRKRIKEIPESSAPPETLLKKLDAIGCDLLAVEERVSDITTRVENSKRAVDPKVAQELSREFHKLQSSHESTRRRLEEQCAMERTQKTRDEIVTWAGETVRLLKRSDSMAEMRKTEDKVEDELKDMQDKAREMASGASAADQRVLCAQAETAIAEVVDVLTSLHAYIERETRREKIERDFQLLKSVISDSLDLMEREISLDVLEECPGQYERDITCAMESVERRFGKWLELLEGSGPAALEAEELVSLRGESQLLWTRVTASHNKQAARLEEHKSYLEFVLQVQDMDAFIRDKLQLVADMTYRSESHIHAKLKQHAVLEGEVRINASQIKLLNLLANKLSRSLVEFGELTSQKIAGLNSAWDTLLEKATAKRFFLEQTLLQLRAHRVVLELLQDTTTIETTWESQPVPQTLTDCRQHLSKVQTDLHTIAAMKNALAGAREDAKDIRTELSEPLETSVAECYERLDQLEKSCASREAQYSHRLEDIVCLHALRSECDWLSEKQSELQLWSADANDDDATARKLQKRLRTLDEEVALRTPAIEALLRRAPDEHREQKHALEQMRDVVLAEKDDLRQRLGHALRLVEMLDHCSTVEHWREEKVAALTAELVATEWNITRNLEKHRDVEIEVDVKAGIQSELEFKLEKSDLPADTASKARKALRQSKTSIDAVRELAMERKALLVALLQFHEFLREVEALELQLDSCMITMKTWNVSNESNDTTFQALSSKVSEIKDLSVTLQAHRDLCFELAENLLRLSTESELVSQKMIKSKKSRIDDIWAQFIQEIARREADLEIIRQFLETKTCLKEVLGMIQEKLSTIAEDSDRLQTLTVQGQYENYMRKHVLFESSLVAIESAIDGLPKFRDPRFPILVSLEGDVRKKWVSLLRRTQALKADLILKQSLYAFADNCKNLMSWSDTLLRTSPLAAPGEEPNSVGEAQALCQNLDSTRLDIEGKESDFRAIVSDANAILQQFRQLREKEGSDDEDVNARVAQVLAARQRAHDAWQTRKRFADQALDFEYFAAEVRLLSGQLSKLETRLAQSRPLADVADPLDERRVHSVTCKSLELLTQKLAQLRVQGAKLTAQKHFRERDVAELLGAVAALASRVEQQARARTEAIDRHIDYAAYVAEADERISWLENSVRLLDRGGHDVLVLRRLAETHGTSALTAKDIDAFVERGRRLAAVEQVERIGALRRQHQAALEQVLQRLAELQQIQLLERTLEGLEKWIAATRALCCTSEEAQKMEEEPCEELLKKLKMERATLDHKELELKEVEEAVDRLRDANTKGLLQRRASKARADMSSLRADVKSSESLLQASLKERKLRRDLVDVAAVITNVVAFVNNVNSRSEWLQHRKQLKAQKGILHSQTPALERIRKEKVVLLESGRLSSDHEEALGLCDQGLLRAERLLRDQETAARLEEAIKRVAVEAKKLDAVDGFLGNDMTEEALTLIANCEEQVKLIVVDLQEDPAEELAARAKELARLKSQTLDKCRECQERVRSRETSYLLLKRIGDVLSVLRNVRVLLGAHFEGESLRECRDMIKTVEGERDKVNSQLAIMGELRVECASCAEMSSLKPHLDECHSLAGELSEAIVARLEGLDVALANLEVQERVAQVKSGLDECWSLGQQQASGSDLDSIVRQHEDLCLRADALEDRVEAAMAAGEAVPEKNAETVSQLQSLDDEWRTLRKHLEERGGKLRDAMAERDAERKLRHCSDRIAVAERTLDDIAAANVNDLATANNAERKLATLRAELTPLSSTLAETAALLKPEAESSSGMFDDLEQKLSELGARAEKQAALINDAIAYYTFCRAVALETAWCAERLYAESVLLENLEKQNLLAMESLLKRLRLSESEVGQRQAAIDNLHREGDSLVANDRFEEGVTETLARLDRRYGELCQQMKANRKRLEEALLCEHFLLECSQVMTWIREKESQLSQAQMLTDDLIETAVTKVESVQRELSMQEGALADIATTRDNIDAKCSPQERDRARNVHESMCHAHTGLAQLLDRVRRELEERRTALTLREEIKPLQEKLARLLDTATSQDYGTSVREADLLIEQLEVEWAQEQQLSQEVRALRQRYDHCGKEDAARNLGDVERLWGDVRDACEARLAALKGARVIHAFEEALRKLTEEVRLKLQTVSQLCELDDEQFFGVHDRLPNIDYKMLNNEMNRLEQSSVELSAQYPDFSHHLHDKISVSSSYVDQLRDALGRLDARAERHRLREEVMSEYRSWSRWLTQMFAQITASELPSTHRDMEYIIQKHLDLLRVIESQEAQFTAFIGSASETRKSFPDVNDKVTALQQRWLEMKETWTQRQALYSQHNDYLRWVKELSDIDVWVRANEADVNNLEAVGSSPEEVDTLLSHMSRMEEAMALRDEKAEKVRRMTLIESRFHDLKAKEDALRQQEAHRLRIEAMNQHAKKAESRAARERIRADERRRTQEIEIPKQRRVLSESEAYLIHGFIERKQESDSDGRRSTQRSWKLFYGGLERNTHDLVLFRSESEMASGLLPSVARIATVGATMQSDVHTSRKRPAFRLRTASLAQYVFSAQAPEEHSRWINFLHEVATEVEDVDSSVEHVKEKRSSIMNKLLPRKKSHQSE